jgi:Na+/H+ antiporter
MRSIEIVLALVGLATVVAGLAERFKAPAPSLLVVVGLVVGVVPGVPDIVVTPEVVGLVVLPPLLFAAAEEVPLRELRAVIGIVARLAVGLVAFSAVCVAYLLHGLLPRVPLAVAFVLGAVLASTDPVAVTALGRRLRLPTRVGTIVQAESLFNDATSLVLFTVAVDVVVAGHGVDLPRAAGQFLLLGGGGVALGCVVALLAGRFRERTADELLETTVALLTPYVAYVGAEAVHVSGVTAVVVAGIVLGRRPTRLTAARARLQAGAVYAVVVFLLESVVFSLIGLQLPRLISRLSGPDRSFWWPALAVIVVVIGTRVVWLFPAAFGPRLLRRPRNRTDRPAWQAVAVASWAGTRGVVPLAAALSIPLTVSGGAPFPHRDLLLVLATSTIVVTLVVQGLTLEPLVRRLGVMEPVEDELHQEALARHLTARAGLARLEELLEETSLAPDVAQRLRQGLQHRVDRARERPPGSTSSDPGGDDLRRLRRALLRAESGELQRLHDEGEIGDAVLRRLQRQLDLEEARLSG